MLKLINSVILLFVISAVLCENCVTYDFGSDFYNTFNNGTSICNGMASWHLGTYTGSKTHSPHPESDRFISPGENLSCVSSYTFEMKATGVLEVYVYTESLTQRDQVVILANQVHNDGGRDIAAGTHMLTPHSPNYVDGWHTVKINLLGNGDFNGYVTFLGVASPGATVIIDSFRYIPPQYDDDCLLYDEDFVPPTAPPQIVPDAKDCVTYDFESQFDDLFNSNRGLCTGFIEWTLNNYTSIPMDGPIESSHQFIRPQTQVSCTSSYSFNVETGGTIEVNAYMQSSSRLDQVAVLVNQVLDDSNDRVVGSAVLTPLHSGYSDGWQVTRIQISHNSNFYGYVSFLGLAAEDSVVLIDSFRYVPPNVDKEECSIYEEELFVTTTPVPTTTPTPTGEKCVTYDFESNFNEDFVTTNQLCGGYGNWHLGNYYSLDIDNIFPESSTFIAPDAGSSCVSSFYFEMKPNGYVEVNVFMSALSPLDYIIVLAKKTVPDGIDTVAGFELYYAGNEDFTPGWNVLKVSISDLTAFNGYITLIGSMAEDSLVLIDSFRYIPPNTEEECKIY